MSRIVFTVAVGDPAQVEGALGLGRSLKLIGDSTPRIAATDRPERGFDRCFDEVWEPCSIEDAANALLDRGHGEVVYLAPEYLAFRRFGPPAPLREDGQVDLIERDDSRVRVWSRSHTSLPTNLVGAAGQIYGKLHLDVRTNLCRWVSKDGEVKLIESCLFRPVSPEAVVAYAAQLKILEDLDCYERTHGFGYVSPMHKFRRSIEKRILKIQGRL